MSFLKNNSFTFAETDPNKVNKLLDPIIEEDVDLDEEDYDSGDDSDDEDEEDDSKPTESYKSIVRLTPPSNPVSSTMNNQTTPSFGSNRTTPQYPFGSSYNTNTNTGYRPSSVYTPNLSTGGFGNSSSFGNNTFGSQFTRPAPNNNSRSMSGIDQKNYRQFNVPRDCRILFCELNDVLVGPKWFAPEGPEEIYGLDPRGVYDLVPKYPVWDVIRQMNPEYVFIITNQPAELGTIEAEEMSQFIIETSVQLARFLRLPNDRCRSFSKFGLTRSRYTKPNTGLLTEALRTIKDVNRRFKREQIYMLGAQSGGLGESNVDVKTAENFGIKYIPVRGIVG